MKHTQPRGPPIGGCVKNAPLRQCPAPAAGHFVKKEVTE